MLAQKLAKARQEAMAAHGTQRYGPYPYVRHLDDVLSTALEFGETDEQVLLATRWHDALEDTQLTIVSLLILGYSQDLTVLVYAVTNEPDPHDTYVKIASGGPRAIRLKLYDRISNVRACWNEVVNRKAGKNKSKLGKYKSEYGAFRKALYLYPEHRPMWDELDRPLGWIP